MASGNFISSTGTNLNLYVTWSSTTNVSANTSTVTANVYMRSYTISGKALTNSYITINGNKKSFANISLSKTSSSLTDTLLTTHTVTVAHNTDGKKSIAIEARLDFNGTVSGKYLDDVVASKTVDLDTIPRASSFTIPSSVNTGSDLTVSISPANSSFKHKVGFIIDGVTKYTSDYIAAGTTKFVYPIPHAWVPNHTSRTMTVRVVTYTSSESYVAQNESTTSVTVPSGIVPTVSSITPTIISGLSGNYVQGKSQVKLTVDGKAGDGATISSYIFTGTNIDGTSSSYTGTSNTKTSSIIKTTGKLTYSVQIKDSRGRISSVKGTDIIIEKYAVPAIASISASRCLQNGQLDANGTYAKITIKTSYSSINGANQRVVKLYSSLDNYATPTTVIAASDTNNDCTYVYGGEFSASQSYAIKAVITDSYNTSENISKSTTLETASRTLNIARYGNGVAVGGLSSVVNAGDAGKFECNWDAYFNDSMFVTNKITCLNPYSARNFNINCYWKDEATHDILVRENDGLNMALGWSGAGSDGKSYETSLDIRPKKVNIRGTMTAPYGRFTSTNDANSTSQENVALRIGDPASRHIDMDVNEIIAKSSATTLAELYLVGSAIGFYGGENLAMIIGSDSTGAYLQSSPVYKRTNSNSPNMYVTSDGTFCRSTSSSERYKTDIVDIIDEELDPYKILNIPVRQFKYNEDNVPVDKSIDDLYIGLIAEEVEKAYPAAAEYTEDGQIEMWNIKVIVPAMLKILQDQQKEIEVLKEEIQQLKINSQGE